MKVLALVVALLSAVFPALSSRSQTYEDSANAIAPGCRAIANNIQKPTLEESLQAPKCVAMVSTLRNVGKMFIASYRYCVPQEAINAQAVKVVVAYLDRIPTRTHEPFLWLAIEALREAWPCR